jgi:hypothetical protein
LRSWKENGKIYIANFIQDLATGKWFLTSTIYRDASTGNLGTYIDTFLENWVGDNPKYDGRYVRKAYLKDAWSLDANNAWQNQQAETLVPIAAIRAEMGISTVHSIRDMMQVKMLTLWFMVVLQYLILHLEQEEPCNCRLRLIRSSSGNSESGKNFCNSTVWK